MAGKAKKRAGAKKVGRKGGKTGGKTGRNTQAALRAEIAALKAHLAAKNAGEVAMDGSIAVGVATRSLLLSNSQIKGDVYLGDQWKPENTNVDETGIGSTSAVGCFRSGRSPSHCEDMSGNVFEWTRSRHEPYPYPADAKGRAKRETPGGDAYRVVRGGCFLFLQWSARAAYRSVCHPAVRINSIGFRVVVSPSVSDP